MGNNVSKLLIDINELSRRTPWNPGAIRNRVYRRQIPYRKIGGRLYFEPEEIEKWLKTLEGLDAKEIEALNNKP